MKRKKLCALIMAAVVATTGLISPAKEVQGYDISAEAKKIVEDMTIEERLGQMLMPDFRKWQLEGAASQQDFTEINDEVAEVIDKYDLGGVILFAENVKGAEQTTRLVHDLQQVAINDKDGNLPLFITLDQEGGIVTRLGEGTNLPGNMALGATRNPEAAYNAGKVIGRELNALGVNVNFGPVMDVNNNPENPVIGVRSISSNPELVGDLASQSAKGIQDQGTAATAKHFPGHGDTATDSHYGLPTVDKSLEQLKETELKPFEIAVKNGIDMIMTAHIQFPQIEKDTVTSKKDGTEIALPATLSDDIIDGVLRKELNYDGVVITDAMNMQAIADHFGELDATKLAIQAGIDIVLMPTILRSKADVAKFDNIYNGVLEAIESGEISEDQINDSAERIVELKIKRGIIDLDQYNKSVEEKVANAKAVVGSKENRAIERAIAEEAITVVKNEDNLLPIKAKEGERVLLITPAADQVQSMKFAINRLVAEGAMPHVDIDSYAYNGVGEMSYELKAKIDAADHIIVTSLASNASHLKPTTWNNKLPKAIINYSNEIGKPAVMISLRNPYDVAAQTDAKAQVIAYGFKGMDPTEGDTLIPTKSSGPNIPAAMGVIFGAVNPTGKLPVDIPALTKDGVMDTSKNYYEYGHGLSNLLNKGNTSITMNPVVKFRDVVDVKVALNDIESLKAKNFSMDLAFDGKVFEFVEIVGSDDIKNVEVKETEQGITVTFESNNTELKNNTDIVVKLKVKSFDETTSVKVTSAKVVDESGRTFTAEGTEATVEVTKVNDNGHNGNNGNKPKK